MGRRINPISPIKAKTSPRDLAAESRTRTAELEISCQGYPLNCLDTTRPASAMCYSLLDRCSTISYVFDTLVTNLNASQTSSEKTLNVSAAFGDSSMEAMQASTARHRAFPEPKTIFRSFLRLLNKKLALRRRVRNRAKWGMQQVPTLTSDQLSGNGKRQSSGTAWNW